MWRPSQFWTSILYWAWVMSIPVLDLFSSALGKGLAIILQGEWPVPPPFIPPPPPSFSLDNWSNSKIQTLTYHQRQTNRILRYLYLGANFKTDQIHGIRSFQSRLQFTHARLVLLTMKTRCPRDQKLQNVERLGCE